MVNIRRILVGLFFWFFGFLKVYFASFGSNKCPCSHTASKQTKKTKRPINTKNTNNWVHRNIWLAYWSGSSKSAPFIYEVEC